MGEDIKLLQKKLDDHIKQFNERSDYVDERFEALLSAQETNTKNIEALTESTTEVVEAWANLTGAAKTLDALGKMMKWLGGIAVIGVFFTWVVDNFSS